MIRFDKLKSKIIKLSVSSLIVFSFGLVQEVLASSVMYGNSNGEAVVDGPIFMTAQSAPTPVSGGGFMYFDGTNFLFSEDGGSAETITEAAGANSGFTDNGSTITTDSATDELLLGSASSSDGHLLKIEESGGSAPYEILSLVHTTGAASPSPTGDNVAITFTADNEFGDPSEYARIMGDLDNTDGTNITGGLAFQTTDSGVFEDTLFVGSSGITASKIVTVSDDVTSQALLTVQQTGASKDAMLRLLNATGGGMYIGIDESDSDKLKFATNVSMTLVPFAVDTANSRVGVNATSPLHTLDVSGVGSGTSPIARFLSNTTTSDASIKFDIFDGQEITMGLDDSDASKFKISDNSELGTNDRLVIDSSGNIGIGESSPGTPLDVNGNVNVDSGSIILDNATAGTNNVYLGSASQNSITFDASQGPVINSTASIQFDIDANNSDGLGSRHFIWKENTSTTSGGTELMRLNDYGLLSRPCPSGFTSIEQTTPTTYGYRSQIGCMQNDEEGTAQFHTALQDCWATYGARIPTGAEWYIAMNNYALSNETDTNEWTSDQMYFSNTGGAFGLVGNGSITAVGIAFPSSSHDYRCWIER